METPTTDKNISDQKRAFLEYKRRVGESGKPFFPHGVYHDVIAAAIVLLVMIGLSTVWFAQANCDSWWDTSCNRASTPLEQKQYTPDEPGVVKREKNGKLAATDAPLLGLLYEEKADPATTSYHPRPEWYFYFLFYLLVLFSNPQLVVLGTIGVPTIWLIILIAFPFLDRKKERRPSRRPVAMAAMVLVAVMLLSFSYLGSQEGKEKGGGPSGLTPEQKELEGYDVLFNQGIFERCQSCHMLGGIGASGPGPNLDAVGTRYDNPDDIALILANGKGGGQMPVKGGTSMTDEQAAAVAAFLSTLGNTGTVGDVQNYGIDDWNRVTGAEDEGSADTKSAGEDGGSTTSTTPTTPKP